MYPTQESTLGSQMPHDDGRHEGERYIELRPRKLVRTEQRYYESDKLLNSMTNHANEAALLRASPSGYVRESSAGPFRFGALALARVRLVSWAAGGTPQNRQWAADVLDAPLPQRWKEGRYSVISCILSNTQLHRTSRRVPKLP